MITIKETLDELCRDVAFDKKLMDKVYRFQIWFLNLNREHVQFFGSNLIGVHTIRWRVYEDTGRFFREVLGLESEEVKQKCARITTINQSFATISDHLNLTLVYMLHRFLTSKDLKEVDRKRAAYDTALVFFYRCIAIRQSEYFKKFSADKRVAEAAYALLSRKFIIRQLGTWGKVMEYRAHAMIAEKPDDEQQLHYKTLIDFTNDTKIAYVISDCENRIRDMYKKYTAVFYKAITAGSLVDISSSTIVDMEGIEKIKEKIKHVDSVLGFIQRTISDEHSFVRGDMIQIISDINSNTSTRMITQTLHWVSAESSQPEHFKLIDQFVRLTVIHTFHLLGEIGITSIEDIPYLLITLKNLYLSTRSTDKDLNEIRNLGSKIISKSSKSINSSLALATRTSLVLYIVLFALVAHR